MLLTRFGLFALITCASSILAGVAHADHRYTRFDNAADRADPGYPRETRCCWPGLWGAGIDAAINWGNGKSYFFKGSQYIRYDNQADAADPGYPKSINSSTWPGLWPSGVDAAVNWGNGKAYFFKGSEYIRYDIRSDRADPGYPRRVNDSTWPGVSRVGIIDSAVNWRNGKVYLFSGGRYVRFDTRSNRTDPGYPKPVDSGTWPGLFTGGVNAAINWGNGKSYFFER